MKTMMLWVLKDNPSLGFYRKQGGKPFAEKTIEIGGAELSELAVGFAL